MKLLSRSLLLCLILVCTGSLISPAYAAPNHKLPLSSVQFEPGWGADVWVGEISPKFKVKGIYSDGSEAGASWSEYTWTVPSFLKALPGNRFVVMKAGQGDLCINSKVDPKIKMCLQLDAKLPLSSVQFEPGWGADVWVGEISPKFKVKGIYSDGSEAGASWSEYTWTVPSFLKALPGNQFVVMKAGQGDLCINSKVDPKIKMCLQLTAAKPSPRLSLGLKVQPDKRTYQVGDTLEFTEDVQGKNQKSTYTYLWYVDGELVKKGRDCMYTFDEPGPHYIQLEIKSSDPKENNAIIKNISVEYPPDDEITIDDDTGSGAGEPGVGVLGRVRNQFEARGAPEKLEILSSYYRGGSGDWSKPIRFNGSNIGAIDKYIMYDGLQDGGWNTGFLVYVPRGRNNIQFKVFHFRWPENPKIGPSPQGIVHYSGGLPLHGKKIVPESIQFTHKASRMCEVEWHTEDGSSCRARINKFKTSNTIRYSGMDDLGCEEGTYPPIEDDMDTGTAKEDDKVDEKEPEPELTDVFVSGVYRVDAWVSRHFPSTWTLKINNGRVSGMSKWGCCPGPRNDPMAGSIHGNSVTITRDCTGQGYSGPCSQKYTGKLNGDVIEGSFTLNERKNFGTWKLYLESREDASLTNGDDVSGTGDGEDDIVDDETVVPDDQSNLQDIEDVSDVESDEDSGVVDGGGAPGNEDDLVDLNDLKGANDAEKVTEEVSAVGGEAVAGETGAGGPMTETEPLVGLWLSQDGHYLHVYKNGDWWEVVALENEGPVGWKKGTAGRFDGQRFSILINSRVSSAEVSKDGNRMDWGHGNYWSLVNASPSAQDIDDHSFHPIDLSGLWVSQDGHEIRIAKNGDFWEATAMENKGSVGWKKGKAGRLNYWTFSIVFGNRAYTADVSKNGNRIDWRDGNYWTRMNSNSSASKKSHGYYGSFIPYDAKQKTTDELRKAIKKRK